MTFTSLGGKRGWIHANGAWRLRGTADRLAGGVGLRRVRRHPSELRVGDAVDFWRVKALEAPRMLRLRSEMRAPGLLWLQFELSPHECANTLLSQTLLYAPRGLSGLLHWYMFYPLHKVVFSGLFHELVRQRKIT
jgi:hypothetical protein